MHFISINKWQEHTSFCYSLLLGQFQLKLFYCGKGRQCHECHLATRTQIFATIFLCWNESMLQVSINIDLKPSAKFHENPIKTLQEIWPQQWVCSSLPVIISQLLYSWLFRYSKSLWCKLIKISRETKQTDCLRCNELFSFSSTALCYKRAITKERLIIPFPLFSAPSLSL